jgi:hypothetical protein
MGYVIAGQTISLDGYVADVDLEKIGIVEVGARTSLRFRVNRA